MSDSYTNRQKVTTSQGNPAGEIAEFSDGTWRRSAHKDATRYDTKQAAIDAAIKDNE